MVFLQSGLDYTDGFVRAVALNDHATVIIQNRPESPGIITKYSQAKYCSDLNVSRSQSKRKADSASVLGVSAKMSKAALGLEEGPNVNNSSTRPSKRQRMEHLSLLQHRISTFEALTSALNDIRNQRDCNGNIGADSSSGYAQNSNATTGACSLPVNVALRNKEASFEVLEMLINADPSSLELQDGHDGSASLSIALLKRSCDIKIANLLLQANPNCVRVADNRGNLPLHVVCARGGAATLELIQRLHMLYPEACLKKNMHGETPLNIAERNRMCSNDVVVFLRRVSTRC